MAKKKVELKVNENEAFKLAVELQTARNTIKNWKKIEETLSDQLLEAFHREHITEAGAYQLSTPHTLKVAEPVVALAWAKENNCIVPEKIDTTKAKEILRHEFTDPSKYGFEVVVSEKIVPKGKKEEQE